MDISDVVSDFGAFYIDEGQNMADLRALLYQPSVTASYFINKPQKNTLYKSVQASQTEVLQPFQKKFVDKGDLTFKPWSFPLFNMMMDKSFYPDEFKDSYLGFFEDLTTLDREKWPFVRWYIEKHLIPQLKKDYELKAVWDGEFVTPTPDVASPAEESMDGINTMRKALITDGRIVPIVTGAFASDEVDFCTQVEEFVEAIDKLYRTELDGLFMNQDAELKYRKGKKKKYNSTYLQAPNLETIELFPNLKVIALPSMGTSEALWTTTALNRVRPNRKAALMETMKISARNNKEVILSTDWWEALGFDIPEIVFTNDRDIS